MIGGATTQGEAGRGGRKSAPPRSSYRARTPSWYLTAYYLATPLFVAPDLLEGLPVLAVGLESPGH